MAESTADESSNFHYRAPATGDDMPMVSAAMEFTINGLGIKTTVPVPAGKTTLRIMLPVLRGFTEAFVHAAVESAAASGEKVSCKAHCGACCRQLVPILESEAYQLKLVVDALPAERRAMIRERFAAARQQLMQSSLWDRIDALKRPTDGVDLQQLATDYFQMGIPCPFLEDESCSIHPERPLVCREYLVSNDPAACAKPTDQTISQIKPLAKMSSAAAMTNDDPPGSRGRYVPLVKLLEWVKENPEPAAEHTGRKLLEDVMTQLLRKRVAGDEG